MTTLWLDAQLSPSLAAWVNRTFTDIEAKSVRALNLLHADDDEIFQAAKTENVVIMSKDRDFLNLLERYGAPPKLIWITCGNTSTQRMKEIFLRTLEDALYMLSAGEVLVEIGDMVK